MVLEKKKEYLESTKLYSGEESTYEQPEKDLSPTDTSSAESKLPQKEINKRPEGLFTNISNYLDEYGKNYAQGLLYIVITLLVIFTPIVCNRISTLSGKVSTLEERSKDIYVLNNKVDEIKEDISIIKIDVVKFEAETNNKLDRIEEKVDELMKKK